MPGHLQYFGASSLSRLLDEEGLPVVRRRFGDDRSIRRLLEIRRAGGVHAGILAALGEAILRLSLGPWSVGAGMVLYGRRRP